MMNIAVAAPMTADAGRYLNKVAADGLNASPDFLLFPPPTATLPVTNATKPESDMSKSAQFSARKRFRRIAEPAAKHHKSIGFALIADRRASHSRSLSGLSVSPAEPRKATKTMIPASCDSISHTGPKVVSRSSRQLKWPSVSLWNSHPPSTIIPVTAAIASSQIGRSRTKVPV